jgi:hypothetical protein
MKGCSRLFIVGCCLLPGSLLFAQDNRLNQILQGSFPFNETIHIVQQAAVDGKCGTSLSGPVTESIINDQGMLTFDGKGGIKIEDKGEEITLNPPTDGSQVVGEAALCKGTYNLLDRHTVDLHYNCSLDHFASYFAVHSTAKLTDFNLLMKTALNSDGTPGVFPYVFNGVTVGCSYVVENTTASLDYSW